MHVLVAVEKLLDVQQTMLQNQWEDREHSRLIGLNTWAIRRRRRQMWLAADRPTGLIAKQNQSQVMAKND